MEPVATIVGDNCLGPLPKLIPRLATQGKYAEAEPLYERSQVILEKVLGSDHPNVASLLNNRAMLLKNQVRARGSCRYCPTWGI